MAVKEFYPSRQMHITKEGTTITQIFTCSDTDLNAWGDGITALPILGLPWSSYREDLRVTDIRSWWLNNKNCRVEVLYSTQGLAYPRNLPDKQSSVTTMFDFTAEPIQLNNADDKYWDFLDGATATWGQKFKTKYSIWGIVGYVTGNIVRSDNANVHELYKCILDHTGAAGNEPGVSEIWREFWEPVVELPAVPKPAPNIVMTEKMNLTGWNWNNIINIIGKVNNADWLKSYVKKLRDRRVAWIDITGNDTGHWLLTGFHCEEIGYRNYEVVLTYTHNFDGWNVPYGLTLGLYETANFNYLPYPDDPDDTTDDGLR